MEYHTSTKHNKEVLYILEGINLQDILLGEKSKIQTTVTCVLQHCVKKAGGGDAEGKKYLLCMLESLWKDSRENSNIDCLRPWEAGREENFSA